MPTSLTAPRIVQTWCQRNALCVPCRRQGCGLAKGVPLCEPFGDLAGNLNHVILPVPCFAVVNDGSHAGNKLAF